MTTTPRPSVAPRPAALPDADTCYRAMESKDPRFDGQFVTAVHSTGIYCRPSCPARTPARAGVTFYPTAAAAQEQGFRACKRCLPDASPGDPQWRYRADVAARAMRLIQDGAVDRDGVAGLAGRLGYTPRHLTRLLRAELGASPQALARSQRAMTARILLARTDLSMAEVAFASGFGSVRQFNDTIRLAYAATPSQLREQAHPARLARPAPSGANGGELSADARPALADMAPASPGLGSGHPRAPHRPRPWPGPGQGVGLSLRLPYRSPIALSAELQFVADRVIAGIEEWDGATYRRTVRLPHGPATLALADGGDHVRCEVHLTAVADLAAATARVHRLLDLDADPQAIDATLTELPELRPLVARVPGLRSPGAIDGFEMAVRAVVGQQISVKGARAQLATIAARLGEPAPPMPGTAGLSVLFPTPEAIAAADPRDLPGPRARAATLQALASACASGVIALDAGADPSETRESLLAIKGIGPWTADYIAMRALGHPDIAIHGDLVADRCAAVLGLSREHLGRCAPWRSYATHHLWLAASHASAATGTAPSTSRRSTP